MTLVYLAFAAVIGAIIAVFVDRGIQARKAKKKAEESEVVATIEQVEAQTPQQPAQFMQVVSNVRNRLTGNKQEKAKKFQVWVESSIEDAELKTWLLGLSPEAAAALAEQLAEFCYNLGFELPWLLDGKMAHDPEIQQEAIAVVTAYCRACWNAARNYSDFELFKLLQEIEQSPFTRKHRDLSRRLFGELVNREMAASVPAELFLASEKEREEHMTQAIRQAAETDRTGFKAILRDVLATQAQEAASTSVAGNGTGAAEASATAAEGETTTTSTRNLFGRKGKKQTAATPATQDPATATEPVAGSQTPEPSTP